MGNITAVADAIKPHLCGGDEILVTGKISDLEFVRLGEEGGRWMDFFEDYLVPQIELRLFILESKTKINYSCRLESWRFRGFKDEDGETIQ